MARPGHRLQPLLLHGFATLNAQSERALFIVDKKGIVRYKDIHAITDQPKNSELFEALKKL